MFGFEEDVVPVAGSCVDFILAAADLLDRICLRLASIGPRDRCLFELSITVASVERLIHSYMLQLMADCGEAPRPWLDDSTLAVTAARLKTLVPTLNTQWKNFGGAQKEGGVNSLLFYLIATLELSLARIREADEVFCGRDAARAREKAVDADSLAGASAAAHAPLQEIDAYDPITVTATIKGQAERLAQAQAARNTMWRWGRRGAVSVTLGAAAFYGLTRTDLVNRALTLSSEDRGKAVRVAGLTMASVAVLSTYRRRVLVWRLRTRLDDSREHLNTWSQKWILVTSVLQANSMRKKVSYHKLIAEPSEEDYNHASKPVSRRLLECVPLTSNKGAFWYSQGALRLLLVRRAMDLVYASVGTAMGLTGDSGAMGLWIPLAGCAATYYALAGPEETSICAAQQVMEPSMGFIKRAWGLVDAPSFKWLSTHASRLLRGLRIAERVYIRGVPCLVLSKRYRPELRKALDRYRKYGLRTRLHSIREGPERSDSDSDSDPERAGEAAGVTDGRHAWGIASHVPEFDVILHVTGGGWFIHTTATDIPYLSEWSATSDAVVILPEYDLMPEHRYPVALTEIYDVYKSLMDGSAAQILGFRPRKIVVSGESAGGNMAAALCVKLCVDGDVPIPPSPSATEGATPTPTPTPVATAAPTPVPTPAPGELEAGEQGAQAEGIPTGAGSGEAAGAGAETREGAGSKSTEGLRAAAEVDAVPAGLTQRAGDLHGSNSSESLLKMLGRKVDRLAETSAAAAARAGPPGVRMPDGLMLSCPSLNVCRSVSPSRIMGAGDPVLPSGVLQMIAESYVNAAAGTSPEDPCVSPYFASDDVLRALPPVLIYVSAVDPLLDDAVDFNTRIRRVGGVSELKATHHVPHAFWGLGSIGFPEVKGVHQYCEAWLLNIFQKADRLDT